MPLTRRRLSATLALGLVACLVGVGVVASDSTSTVQRQPAPKWTSRLDLADPSLQRRIARDLVHRGQRRATARVERRLRAAMKSRRSMRPRSVTPEQLRALRRKLAQGKRSLAVTQRRRRAQLRSPAARHERRRSRTRYAGKHGASAFRVAQGKFGDVLDTPPANPLTLESDDRLIGFQGPFNALVERRGADGRTRTVLLDAMSPVRSSVGSGRPELVDLALESRGEQLVPRNPLVRTVLSRNAARAAQLPGTGVSVSFEDSGEPATVSNSRIFYPNVAPDTDGFVWPTPEGVELAWQLRAVTSPEEIDAGVVLPHGAELRQRPAARAIDIVKGSRTLASLSPPKAVDAQGQAVPVEYRLRGATIKLNVAHRQSSHAYPILVDPVLNANPETFGLNPDGTKAGDGCSRWNSRGWWGTTNVGGFGYVTHSENPYWVHWENSKWTAIENCGAWLFTRYWMWYAPEEWSEWIYGPYRQAYISAVNFWTDHTPWYTCINQGLWDWAAGNWNAGRWRHDVSIGNEGPSPWVYDQSAEAKMFNDQPARNRTFGVAPCESMDRNMKQHHAYPPARGNSALFVLRTGTIGLSPSSILGQGNLRGSLVWLGDYDSPVLRDVAHGSQPPAGWVHRWASTVNANAYEPDPGLGIRWFNLFTPQINGPYDGYGLQQRDAGCIGNVSSPCATSNNISDLPGGQFSYDTDASPEGVHQVLLAGYDALVQGSNVASWGVKLDRTPPKDATFAGSLHQSRELVTGDSYDLMVAAEDGDPTGVSSGTNAGTVDRSGVESVSFAIKRGASTVQSARSASNSTCHATNGCSRTFSAPFGVTVGDLGDGIYQVGDVTSRDQLGTGANAAQHTRVQATGFSFLRDRDAPTINPPTHTGLDKWHGAADPITTTLSGGDQGAGVKSFELALGNGGAVIATEPRACAGTLSNRCALADSHTFSYAPDAQRFPQDGRTQVRGTVIDGAGRRSPGRTWDVKVDRTGPEVTLFGGLVTPVPTSRELHVDAKDGTALEPRSGVRRIELFVDGDRDGEVEPTEREAYEEQTCAVDSCPMDLDWAVPADYPEGYRKAKVVATDQAGNVTTKPFDFYLVNLLPTSRSKLGLEDFFDYESLDAGGDSRVHVNAETGNAVWHSVPIVNPGRGLSTFVNLTYNSLDRGGLLGSQLGRLPLVDAGGADLSQDLSGLSYGEAGTGFSIAVSGPTRVNEPLGGVELAQRKEELNDQTAFLRYLRDELGLTVPDDTPLGDAITLTDADGTVHTFQRGDDGEWIHPPGVAMHLRRFNPATATRVTIVPDKWAMTRPDGVTHFFDNLGYLTSTKDRNGNTLRYDYQHVSVVDGEPCPAGTPIGKLVTEATTQVYCIRRLFRVVDPAGVTKAPDPAVAPPAGNTLSIAYRPGGLLDGKLPVDSPVPFPGLIGGRAGRIASITDHKGRAYGFTYDADGFLTEFTEVTNATGDERPRTTKLVYEAKSTGSPFTPIDDGLGQDRQLTDVVEVRDGSEYARTKLGYQSRSESPPVPGVLRKPRKASVLTSRTGFDRALTYAENADGSKDMRVVATIAEDAAGAAVKTTSTLHQVDGRGRPISLIDGLGRQTTLAWNHDHRVTKITEAAGTPDAAVTDLAYTGEPIDDPCDVPVDGLLKSRTTYPQDGPARTTSLCYRPSRGVYRSTVGGIDGSDKPAFVADLAQIANPKSATGWTYAYADDRGNPTQRIDAADHKTTTTYDQHGQVHTETDEVGNVTEYGSYHDTGQPQVVTDPKQRKRGPFAQPWRYEYDTVGNVLSVTDPRGADTADPSDFKTTLGYDAFDRLVREVVPKDTAGGGDDVIERSRRYDRNGNLTRSQDGNDDVTTFQWTKMDQTEQVDAPGSRGREVTKLGYDGLDRLVRRTRSFTPGGPDVPGTPDAAAEFLIDAAGQTLAETRSGESSEDSHAPATLTTSFAYDGRGNVVRVLDPKRNGRRTAQQAADAARNGEARVAYRYNRVDELVEEKQVASAEDDGVEPVVTRYAYDANGNRVRVEHPRRFDLRGDDGDTSESAFLTKLAYDHRDQVTAITDPAGHTRNLARRADGKVVADTDPRGARGSRHYTTTYVYDELGEIVERGIPYAPGQYGLSESTLDLWRVRYARDEVGNPTTITDPRGNAVHNAFYDTGELKRTDRPSYWRLDWGGNNEDEGGAHAGPDAGERFQAKNEADAELVDGGPRLVERLGRSANAERSEEDPELPTSMGYGNFGSVDREELGDLLPAAGTTSFDYDGEMRLTDVIVSTPEGSSPRSIGYDDAGRVTRKTWHFRNDEPIGGQGIDHRFSYDGRGNLKSFVDGENRTTTYDYDAFDRRFRETAPGAGSQDDSIVEPEVTHFGYDDNGNLTRRRTPRGDAYTFTYGYDTLDRLVRETNPEGDTWRYCLDVAGNRVVERPPRGAVTQTDVCDEVPTGQFDTTSEFDAADRLAKQVDPLGEETRFEYDGAGNLTKVDAPGAPESPSAAEQRRITTFAYDGRGQQSKQTVGTGDGARTTHPTIDANGNLRRVVNPKGVADDPGDEASDPALTKNATLRKYNRDDLLTEIHLPWGERDDLDRKRYVQRFDRDSRGRVRSMFAPHELGSNAAEQTSYTHFENDWIRTASDPQVNEPTSPAPRVDKHLVAYDYDRQGNQTLWRTRNSDTEKGRIVTRQFWPNGQLRSRTGNKVTDAGNDETSRRTYRYGYNGNRSLVRMVDERTPGTASDDRATTFGRDRAERETFVNETWTDGKDTRYAYDPNGNVSKRETDGRWNGTAYVDSDSGRNDAKTTTFAYDELDRERTMTVAHGDDGPRVTRRTYHPSGDVATKTSPNGVLEERYFNRFGEPSQTRRKRSGGASGDWTLKSQEYGYDGNGNRTRDERGTHEFNARDQLVKWTRGGRNGAHGTTVSYELNASGAITKRTDSALSPGKQVVTYTYNGTRLAKTEDSEFESTYSYDDFGNVIRIRGVQKVAGIPPPPSPLPALPVNCESLAVEPHETRYCYDEFERLVVAKGQPARNVGVYEYDGLDRKDRKTVRTPTGDQTRDLSYVGTTRMLSRERDNAGETHYYDYDSRGERQGKANAPTTTPNPSTYRSYGHDANGTVEELQASDGSVGEGDRYRYDPYGELERKDPRSTTEPTNPTMDAAEIELSASARENPFRFQGFYYDSGVKTYDMHARHYRPDTGRFLSQDRFESARGDYNLQADPLTQNRYVFGGANPVNNVEFDGHDYPGGHNLCRRCGPTVGRANQTGGQGGRSGGGAVHEAHRPGGSAHRPRPRRVTPVVRPADAGRRGRIQPPYRNKYGEVEKYDVRANVARTRGYADPPPRPGECVGTCAFNVLTLALGGPEGLAGKAAVKAAIKFGLPVVGAVGRAVITRSAADGGARLVIGKLEDLARPGALRTGERVLLLPNAGSPKANWARNASELRRAMRSRTPIRDASVSPNGELRTNTGFLRAERELLRNHGWRYSRSGRTWHPPG